MLALEVYKLTHLDMYTGLETYSYARLMPDRVVYYSWSGNPVPLETLDFHKVTYDKRSQTAALPH